jgi:hypothetical protein
MYNVIISKEEFDEFEAKKEKIKELEALVDSYRRINELESIKEADKAALIKENDRLTNVVHKQGTDIIDLRTTIYETAKQNEAIIKERDELRIKNDELKNKVIRFKELVTENYRLKMSVNDLKEHNKELKAKIKEPVGMVKIDCDRDWKDVYPPDRNTNIKIENLYITNNYFSEEDERND